MNLIIFDYSLGHSRDIEDDSFVRSTRQRRHDYNSETMNKNSNIYIHTTLNENGDVTTNVTTKHSISLLYFHSNHSSTQLGPTNDYIISSKNELQSHQATFG